MRDGFAGTQSAAGECDCSQLQSTKPDPIFTIRGSSGCSTQLISGMLFAMKPIIINQFVADKQLVGERAESSNVRQEHIQHMELIDVFYATDSERTLAENESAKLKNHILKLAPALGVNILPQCGRGSRLSDFHRGALYYGVYNAPIRAEACAITFTFDEAWINQGASCYGFYRGHSQVHLRGRDLLEQGERSVETSIHEWLHYYAYKKWCINVDDQAEYVYPMKNSDSVANGWYHWYSTLLGDQKPQKKKGTYQ